MPTAKAGAQCRVTVPSPPRRHGGRGGQWGQARLMGASEAGGGRRGLWGQARLVGAGEANGDLKPPGQIPSQHSPFAPRLSRPSKTKPKKLTKAYDPPPTSKFHSIQRKPKHTV